MVKECMCGGEHTAGEHEEGLLPLILAVVQPEGFDVPPRLRRMIPATVPASAVCSALEQTPHSVDALNWILQRGLIVGPPHLEWITPHRRVPIVRHSPMLCDCKFECIREAIWKEKYATHNPSTDGEDDKKGTHCSANSRQRFMNSASSTSATYSLPVFIRAA